MGRGEPHPPKTANGGNTGSRWQLGPGPTLVHRCGDAVGWGQQECSYWWVLLGPRSTAPCKVGTPVPHSGAVALKQLGSPELQELVVLLAARLWHRLRHRLRLGLRAPQLSVPLQVFDTKVLPPQCQQYPAVLHCTRCIEPFPLCLLINPTLLCPRYMPHPQP